MNKIINRVTKGCYVKQSFGDVVLMERGGGLYHIIARSKVWYQPSGAAYLLEGVGI